MGSAVTRRGFLARSVLAGGAFLMAGIGGPGLLRQAAGAGRLSPSRRRTYVALVDAVGRASRSQVDPSRAGTAADLLAAEYAASLASARAGIDDVLDRLEGVPAARPFSALDPAARIAVLRGLAAGDGDLAGRAVTLAAAPFHPPADEYHPTPVIL